MIIETERLQLRELTQNDFKDLCKILKDEEVMYAYEGAFTDQEVTDWLNRQIHRYKQDGIGLWAVILKENQELIGQCGLTYQQWKEEKVLEIGYLFQKAYWHKGYAIEAARACKIYARDILKATRVCSIIRNTNLASSKVAIKNGMHLEDQWVKHYRGIDMPHQRYIYYFKKNLE